MKLCLELCFYLALLASTSMPRPATASEKKEQRRKEGKKKISTACFNIRRTPGHLKNCYFRLWFIIFVAVTHNIFITWNRKNKGVQFLYIQYVMPPKEARLNILFCESRTKRVRYFCYLMSTLGDLYLDEGPLWFHCDGATTQIVGCVSRSGSICSQKKHRTFVPPPRSANCPSVSVWKASFDCAGCRVLHQEGHQ